MQTVAQDDEQDSQVTMDVEQLTHEISTRNRKSRRISMVHKIREHGDKLNWLVSKFQDFQPEAWWMYCYLLVLRLLQTCFIVLVPRKAQAVIAMLFAVVGFVSILAWRPYRRPSNNVTAWLAQLLIFAWCTTLVLQDVGLFKNCPAYLIGSILTCATVTLPIWCFKTVYVEIMQASENQKEVTTRTEASRFKKDDYIVRDERGRHWVVDASEFIHQFELETVGEGATPSETDGFARYRSTTKLWVHELSESDVMTHFPNGKFSRTDGTEQVVKPGDVLSIPYPEGGELSCLEKHVFENKYERVISHETTTHSADGESVPSQTETLVKWENIIKANGKRYQKVTRVHAKVAQHSGTISTIVDGGETREFYAKGDYIVVGSRGGRHPMGAPEFAARYLSKQSKAASDGQLGSDGFRLYEPKGMIWGYQVSQDEIRQSFPAGKYYGRWGTPIALQPNDFLVISYPLGSEIYTISNATLHTSYVPYTATTETMALTYWEAVLRQDARLFCKKTVVHAKLALADGYLSELLHQHQPPPLSSSPSNGDAEAVAVEVELSLATDLQGDLSQGKLSEC